MEWIQVLTIIVSIGGIVWLVNSLTNKRLDGFKEDLKEMKTKLERVVEALISKEILKPLSEIFMKSSSPLNITESGQKFLEKNNIEDLYLSVI